MDDQERSEKRWATVERKILAAVRKGKKAGVDLVYGTFGNYEPGKKCCVLSMVVANVGYDGVIDVAAEKLGLTYSETWSVVHGFDGSGYGVRNSPGYQLGLRLREKFQPQRGH